MALGRFSFGLHGSSCCLTPARPAAAPFLSILFYLFIYVRNESHIHARGLQLSPACPGLCSTAIRPDPDQGWHPEQGAQQLRGQAGFMICLRANVGGFTFHKAHAKAPSPPPPCTLQAVVGFSCLPTPSPCPSVGLVNVPEPTQGSRGQPCPGLSPAGAAECAWPPKPSNLSVVFDGRLLPATTEASGTPRGMQEGFKALLSPEFFRIYSSSFSPSAH